MASSEALARAWADKDSAADAFSLAVARRLLEGANPILIPMVLGRPADFEYHEDIRWPIALLEVLREHQSLL